MYFLLTLIHVIFIAILNTALNLHTTRRFEELKKTSMEERNFEDN